MYSDLNDSNKFYYGLSFSANPLMVPEADYADEIYNNLNLIYSETNYYSINDIPGTLSNVTVINNTQVVTTGDCPADEMFMWSGNIKVCVDRCPDDNSFKRLVGTESNCYRACSDGEYAMKDDQSNCLSGSCSSNSKKTYGNESHCVDTCQEDYPYLNGSNCVLQCPLFLESVSNQYPPIESGNCLGTCPFYAYQNWAYKYDDGTFKIYCVNKCPSFVQLSTSQPIITADKGFCVDACLDYIMETDFAFESDNTPKTFCLPSCPDTFHYIEQNGLKRCIPECTEEPLIFATPGLKCVANCFDEGFTYYIEQNGLKRCVPECTEEPFIFATPGLKCVANCLDEGFDYYDEDNSCTNTCNLFINDKVKCVTNCPEDKPFADNQHCVTECPSIRPFVENYSNCVEACSDRFDGIFCVSTCNEALLVKWFSDREEPFISKPFTGKSRECREACNQPGVEHIHSGTLDCLVKCPSQGHRYVDSKKICRASCEDDNFPYRDEETVECLSVCKPERPFIIPEENECVEKCPSDLRFSLDRRQLAGFVCQENCDQARLECIASCPDQMKLRLEKENTTECLSVCPQGYSPDKDGFCKFDCLPELGYSKDNNGCFHCLNDKNMFLEGNLCVKECSKGKVPNIKGICVTCLSLRLWEDEEGNCKPMHLCHSLSQFDFTLKRCFKCSGNGLKLIFKENQAPICETSTCSKGNIEMQSDIVSCFECNPGRFYYEKACYTFCPPNTDYDLIKMKCTVSCMTACTSSCCLGGTCQENICRCQSDALNSRCDVTKDSASSLIESIVDMLDTRIRSRLLQLNESHLIGEMALILERNSLRLLNEVNSSHLFVINTLAKLKQQFVQGSFQLRLFQTLDFLLGLAVTIDTIIQNNSLASEVLNLVDTFSDKVVELSNTAIDHSMRGKYLSLTFKHNIFRQNTVNIQECLDNLEISNWTFPYKKIEFSFSITAQITRNIPEALIINSNPLSEFYVYSPSGKIDLNTVCSPKSIDTDFPAQLDSNQKTLVDQFKSTPFNIFNPSDPFFNDRCVVYDFEGKDITLDERQKMLVDPKNLCAESPYQVCEAIQTENGVECVCKGIRSKPKSAFESVTSSYPENNYILFTCLTVFKNADFLSNTGFYMVGVPFLLGIILSFYYSIRVNNDLESDAKFNYLRQDSTLFKPASMNKYIYFTECLDLGKRLKKIRSRRGLQTNHHLNNILPTIGDLRHLTAEEMLFFDKRSHFQFMIDCYVQLHPAFKAFFKSNLRSTPTFDIMLFVTETNLTSTMSAFFINDKMVQRKNIEGDPSLMDSISQELIQTVWAVCTSLLIIRFVKSFLKVDKLRQRNVAFSIISGKIRNPRGVYDRYVTNHRLKMMLFLLLSICLNMVFTYFTVIYSELYSNSQSIWLNGIIIGLLIKHGILRAICPFLLVFSRILVSIFPSTFIFFKGCLALTNKLVRKE